MWALVVGAGIALAPVIEDTSTDAGRWLLTVAAIVAAAGVVAKFRPFRWVVKFVYSHLFGAPVSAFFRKHVAAVIDEKLLKRNGGTTVPDAIHQIERLRLDVERWHDGTDSRLDDLEHYLDRRQPRVDRRRNPPPHPNERRHPPDPDI